MFEAGKGSFDDVAELVDVGVEREQKLAIGLVGDNRGGAAALEKKRR